MKNIIFIVFFFTYVVRIYSQDTIMFVNKSMVVAKIIEIGINDITYFKFDSINGKIFISQKKEITRIKFENAKLDTLNVLQKPRLAYQKAITTFTPIVLTEDRLKRLSYNERPLGVGKLYDLIITYPNPQGRVALFNEFIKMKRYRRIKNVVAFIGYTLGGEALFMTGIFSVVDKNYTYACLGASIALFGTSIPIAVINRTKYINKRREIAILYNKGLE